MDKRLTVVTEIFEMVERFSRPSIVLMALNLLLITLIKEKIMNSSSMEYGATFL